MESYALRGVGGEGRTRSNSTVSASSIGGMMAMDGAPMANKVQSSLRNKHTMSTGIKGTTCFVLGSTCCVLDHPAMSSRRRRNL